MRVCVPLLAATGDEAERLADHFGQAERFAVLDSVSGEIVDQCRVVGRCPGPCACPLPDLAGARVDALAGGAMGYRVLQLSRRAGIPALRVAAKTLTGVQRELGAGAGHPLAVALCLTAARSRA